MPQKKRTREEIGTESNDDLYSDIEERELSDIVSKKRKYTKKKNKDNNLNDDDNINNNEEIEEDDYHLVDDDTYSRTLDRVELRKRSKELIKKINQDKVNVKNEFFNLNYLHSKKAAIWKSNELTIDAEYQSSLNRQILKQSSILSISTRYSYEDLVVYLSENFRVREADSKSSTFQWAKLGSMLNLILANPYPLSSLSLSNIKQIVKKDRKAKEKKGDENVELKTANQLKTSADEDLEDPDILNTKRVENLSSFIKDSFVKTPLVNEHLERKNFEQVINKNSNSSSNSPNKLNILNLLVDPISNIQTIENFFDFSILVKHNQLFLSEFDNKIENEEKKEDHIPKVVPTTINNETKHLLKEKNNQMVLTINMRDINKLKKKLYQNNSYIKKLQEKYENSEENDEFELLNQVKESTKRHSLSPQKNNEDIRDYQNNKYNINIIKEIFPLHRYDEIYFNKDPVEQADILIRRGNKNLEIESTEKLEKIPEIIHKKSSRHR